MLRLFDQRHILSVCGSFNHTVRFQCLHPISVSPFHGTMSARHPHRPRWHNEHNLLSLDAEKGGLCMLRDVVQMKTACLRIMASNWMNKQSSGGWTESLLIPVAPPRPLIVVTVVVYRLSSNEMLLCSQMVGKVLWLVDRKQLQWEDVRCRKLDSLISVYYSGGRSSLEGNTPPVCKLASVWRIWRWVSRQSVMSVKF